MTNIKLIIRIIIYLLLSLIIYLLKNESNSLPFIGLVFTAVSLESIFSFRHRGNIKYLIAILAIINISLIYSVYFNPEENVVSWQIGIYNTSANIITAKSCVLFFIFFLIGATPILKKDYIFLNSSAFFTITNKLIKPNQAIFYGGLCILIFSLIFGFDRSISDSYKSNGSAMYEYAILVYLFTWLYSRHKKIDKVILIIYATLYILQGIFYGDRSSAFPMILLVFILIYNDKIKMSSIMVLSCFAIFAANLVGIYRVAYSWSEGIFEQVIDRLLYVDSLVYSYYGGTQIITASNIFDDRLENFFQWIIGIFLGQNYYTPLSTYVSSYSGGFFNRGGGMTHAYLYFWFGIIGTIIGALLMGIITYKVFISKHISAIFFQMLIIVFSMRWYVYFPQIFFRTCLIIPAICYFLCYKFDTLLKNYKLKK